MTWRKLLGVCFVATIFGMFMAYSAAPITLRGYVTATLEGQTIVESGYSISPTLIVLTQTGERYPVALQAPAMMQTGKIVCVAIYKKRFVLTQRVAFLASDAKCSAS